MAKARAFEAKLREASAVAKEKLENTVGSGTDAVNNLAGAAADKMEEKGGFLGGLMGKVVEGTTAV